MAETKEQRELRVHKLHLVRVKDQMSTLVKSTLTMEGLSKLEALLAEYKLLKRKFDESTDVILMSLDDNESNKVIQDNLLRDSATVSDILASFEARAKTVRSTLEGNSKRDSLASDLNNSFRASSMPKVEKIKVPKFDGNILEFRNFKGLYENLVHNNADFSNVQKLYYLKLAMIGEAHALVRDFELTEEDYTQAWALVKSRYDNKLLVIDTLFRKLTDLQPIKHESKIRSLLDETDIVVPGLIASGETIDATFSKFIAFLVLSKLDNRTAKDFRNSLESNDCYPTYEQLQKFLNMRAFITKFESNPTTTTKQNDPPSKSAKSSFVSSKEAVSCALCGNSHSLADCKEFIALNQQKRYELVKSKHLCIRCLYTGHSVSACRAKKGCASCSGKHHSLLHRNSSFYESTSGKNGESSSSGGTPQTPPEPEKKSVNTITDQTLQLKSVVLATAVTWLKVTTKNGMQVFKARLLLDNGSQATLISEEFVRRHNIFTQRSQAPIILGGITGNSVSTNSIVQCVILSRYNVFEIDIEADVVSKIPYSIDSVPIVDTVRCNPKLDFAECKLPYSSVDIVVGAEYYEACIRNVSRKCGNIFLRDSEFGWLISGPYSSENSVNDSYCGLTTLDVQCQLAKFWEIEEIDGHLMKVADALKLEHQQCEEFIAKNLQRNEEGRFVTKLPLKIERESLGESKPKAIGALKRIEQKYDPDLREKYVEVMNEYLKLGHMEEVSPECDEPTYYIPHRAVVKPSSTTTKVRVVFNASCPSKSGLSLNDIMMSGPTVQPEQFDILIRFRTHVIAFTCDIAMMYRQILIALTDRNLQRIVWRFVVNGKIIEFVMNTLTFGTTAAPFIATYCLKQLGISISSKHPKASRAIQEDFVIDNLLTGAQTLEEAVELKNVIHQTLKDAHFPLRKYMSNDPQLLADLDSSLIEETNSFYFGQKDAISLLGLFWQPSDDSMAVKLNLREDLSVFDSLTKRLLLSEIARVYDPIGVIAPVTIRAKIMLQDVWSENRSWDDVVSPNLIATFKNYYADLPKLSAYSIRRRYSLLNDVVETQLIGFCDASERAYSAVVYFRSVDKFGNVDSYFIVSKTKVAPRNEFKLTIPKLELQAAELLSRLLLRLSNVLQVKSCFAFSDSTTVLAWLNGDINRWTVFVQNRVKKIVAILPPSVWYYVRSKENPADLATRGLSVDKFISCENWLKGPNFLLENFDSYLANSISTVPDLLEIPEQRTIKIVNFVSNTTYSVDSTAVLPNLCMVVRIFNPHVDWIDHMYSFIEKFSSFVKLVNIFIYVARFVKMSSDMIDLTKEAWSMIIRIVQRRFYGKEIAIVSDPKKSIPKTSPLYGLDLFLDDRNVLRCKSRLENSLLSYEYRNLIVLPAKCHFLKLLVIHTHERFFHASLSFVLNYIKSMYLVRGGLVNNVKHVLRDCVKCKKMKAKTMSQKMGQLPSVRVVIDRPFNNVGVDLAGPFSVKCVGHRTTKFGKLYAAIFVCMCTKAVHIEVLSSLSTESFIATLDRFVARRGVPSNIYSDNATNFIGCNGLLKSIHAKNFRWNFIPPRTPHQGGLWEASVKSAKKHLAVVTNGHTLTFEEYATVFASIEAILNSRPLCHDAGTVLTPAHFLVGSNLLIPSAIPDDLQPKLLGQRFKLQQTIVNSFWRIWSKDYLNQIRNANKWRKPEYNLKPGDIVLVKDDLLHVSKWPMGIIEKVYPDSENLIRIVDVKFNNSIKRRNVSSLVLLLSGDDSHPHGGE